MQNPLLQTSGRRSGYGSGAGRGCPSTRPRWTQTNIVARLRAPDLTRGHRGRRRRHRGPRAGALEPAGPGRAGRARHPDQTPTKEPTQNVPPSLKLRNEVSHGEIGRADSELWDSDRRTERATRMDGPGTTSLRGQAGPSGPPNESDSDEETRSVRTGEVGAVKRGAARQVWTSRLDLMRLGSGRARPGRPGPPIESDPEEGTRSVRSGVVEAAKRGAARRIRMSRLGFT
jgi:hypothetical protein